MLRLATKTLLGRSSQILSCTNTILSSSSDLSSTLPHLWALVRGARKAAPQVRAGDLVQRDGRPFRVVKFHWMHGQARASGFITLDLMDLASGARTSEKLRLEDQVELADVESKQMQVLYEDDTGIHVMDSSTFEQGVISPELFGEGRRWLTSSPELMVDVSFFEGEAVAARVPHKLPVLVVDAPPAVVKADGSSTRHVVVQGGVSVMAPSFVRTGDIILVRTEDASYMAKAGAGE